MTAQTVIFNPFAGCDENCNHDLAVGVLVADLLREDGPHAPVWVLAGIGFSGALTPHADEHLAAS